MGGSIYVGLTARKPGYTQDNSQRQLQQVSLSALESDLLIKLNPESTIQGRIATPVDDHPEGIRVMLLSRRIQEGSPVWSQTSMSVTDSRGEFRFAGLQPGRYRLLTQDWSDDPDQANALTVAEMGKPVSRYAPTSYPATASEADLRLTSGDVEQVNLNLHPQTYVPVRIPVALPEGGPPGLQVRVQRSGTIESAQSGLALRYVPREKAVRGLLPSGQYEIVLQANGGGPTASGSAAVVQLTVGGSRVETAAVTLQPMPSIPVIVHQDLTRSSQSGDASDSSATAIAGRARVRNQVLAGAAGHGDFSSSPVQVLLVPPPGTSQTVIAHRRIGSDDTVLEPVPPGTYRLEATAPGGYIAAATSGGTDLLSQRLVVTPGSGVAPIELTVRDDTATLRGTLDPAIFNANASSAVSSSGPELMDPSNFVLISCIPAEPNGRRLMQEFVRRDGSFTVNNLPPGSYRVYASRTPLEALEYRSAAFTREYGSKGQLITLESNGNATVTLTSVIEEPKDP